MRERDRNSEYERIQVLFGTDYFLENVENAGRVKFFMGAHHRGFKADVSEVEGQLHKCINAVLPGHPESAMEQE